MVSAFEPRSPACAHHLTVTAHHPLARARFSALIPATHLPDSSCVCRRRLADAPEPTARENGVCERARRLRMRQGGGAVCAG
eukprot:462368-Prymnesium_polylepis.1